MNVGFIGLGNIGAPMAAQFAKAGHNLTVHNRTRTKAEPLAALGAQIADTPADVVAASDIIFTCLLMPDQVTDVYLGDRGLIASADPSKVLCDTSTVDPLTSRAVAEVAAKTGVPFFDAPVSGGPEGAEQGVLSVMVGGPEEHFARLRPALEVFGAPEKVVHLGPAGAGSTAKICNQMIVGVTHALVGEVLVLGKKAGMNPDDLFKVMMNSSAQSNTLERVYAGFVASRDFSAKFAMPGIAKDLDCGLAAAKALGCRTLFAPIARELYGEAIGLGHGDKDVAAVILPIEAIAGVEVTSD